MHNFAENIVFTIYGKIFHEEISSEISQLVKNLFCVGAGTIVGTLFIFIFNVLAGRFMGPAEYGKFTLVNSISLFLFLPMLMGTSISMVKYNAEKEDFYRQQNIISTTYILSSTFTSISLCFYYLLSVKISELLSIPIGFFYLAIYLSLSYAFYQLTISTLQSLNKMKLFSILKIVYGVFTLGFFLILIYLKYFSFNFIVISMGFSYILTGLIIIINVRKYFTYKLDLQYVSALMGHGIFNLLSGVSHILYINIDKIIIYKYMLIEDVGLYNAYIFSTISIITIFSGIFSTVFFPTISKYNDKTIVLKKVNKIIPYITVLGIPFTLISGFFVLKLYGEMYPYNISLMIAFAVTSILIIWYSLYGNIYNSEGIRGAKVALLGTSSISVTDISFNILLIPHFGLLGAIIATALAHAIGIIILHIYNKKIFYSQKI